MSHAGDPKVRAKRHEGRALRRLRRAIAIYEKFNLDPSITFFDLDEVERRDYTRRATGRYNYRNERNNT